MSYYKTTSDETSSDGNTRNISITGYAPSGTPIPLSLAVTITGDASLVRVCGDEYVHALANPPKPNRASRRLRRKRR